MTTGQHIQNYSTAIDELQQARTKIQQMHKIINEVSCSLLNPYEFTVSNVNVEFPPESATVKEITSLDANEWPSAQQIAEAIVNLHHRYLQAQNAYNALSEKEQEIVGFPPDKK